MSKDQNLEVTRKLGEAVSTGNLQALKDIFSSDLVDHDHARRVECNSGLTKREYGSI